MNIIILIILNKFIPDEYNYFEKNSLSMNIIFWTNLLIYNKYNYSEIHLWEITLFSRDHFRLLKFFKKSHCSREIMFIFRNHAVLKKSYYSRKLCSWSEITLFSRNHVHPQEITLTSEIALSSRNHIVLKDLCLFQMD